MTLSIWVPRPLGPAEALWNAAAITFSCMAVIMLVKGEQIQLSWFSHCLVLLHVVFPFLVVLYKMLAHYIFSLGHRCPWHFPSSICYPLLLQMMVLSCVTDSPSEIKATLSRDTREKYLPFFFSRGWTLDTLIKPLLKSTKSAESKKNIFVITLISYPDSISGRSKI